MKRATSDIIKILLKYLALIAVIGYSIGLIIRFFGDIAGNIVGGTMLLAAICWSRYKIKRAKDSIKHLLELLQEDKENKLLYVDESKKNDYIFFEFNSLATYYSFKMSFKKEYTKLQANFILRNNSFERTWNNIAETIKEFETVHPEVKNIIEINKTLLFNKDYYCSIYIESYKIISQSKLLLVGSLLKKIEKEYLQPQEDYINFYVPLEGNTYYVHYLNGVYTESYVKDEEETIWGMETDILDDEYRTLIELNKIIKPEEIIIRPYSKEKFLETKSAAVCELD